jgi:hypothetical protein
MKDQLDSSFADNKVKKSKSAKGLDTAALIMGIVGFLIACIPYAGAASLFITSTGVIIGIVAIVRAKAGGEIRQGMAVTGLILNILAIGLSIFWIYMIIVKVMESAPAIGEAIKNADTTAIRQNIEKALE